MFLDSIIKAFLKLWARKVSDASYNKEKKKVHGLTYTQIGRELKYRKKQGKRFDARKAYRNKFNQNMKPVEQRKARRDKFIDDL